MPTETNPLLLPSGEMNQSGGCLRENWPALDRYATQSMVGSGVEVTVPGTLGDDEGTVLPAPTLVQALNTTARMTAAGGPSFTRVRTPRILIALHHKQLRGRVGSEVI